MSVEDDMAAMLDAEIERLTKLRNQLRTGAPAAAPAKRKSANGRRKRGKMSAEGRRRISEAQKKRHAARRAAQEQAANQIELEANQPAKRGRKKK